MKKLIVFSVCAALALALAFAPTPASAGDEYKASLTSDDAGSTNTASLSAGLHYSIQCKTEACYKTGSSSSMSASCATDFVLQPSNECNAKGITGSTTIAGLDGGESVVSLTIAAGSAACRYQRDFQSGTHTKIVAKALDAGNPDCRVFQHHKNP